MVRTGQRAGVLQEFLVAAGLKLALRSPKAPRLQDIDDDLREQELEMYRSLGGTAAKPNLRPGVWDIALADGRVVELDEELHFNRYRLATLRELHLSSLPWCSDYQDQCVAREQDCLRAGRWGKRWVNDSTAAMFGPAAEPGDLIAPSGAPRWKQRALYDAMKDLSTMQAQAPSVVRLSVHDIIAGARLGAALEHHTEVDPYEVAAFAETRTS
jgi:hypothetical protein